MILDLLQDNRSNCYSLMVQMPIGEYLEKIRKSFENKGGLEGQRDSIKTKTAQRIRERMIDDLKHGAVLPPLVLGAILTPEQIKILDAQSLKNGSLDVNVLENLVKSISSEDLFIIDGMQRTTALSEAMKKHDINDKLIRIEYWLASKVNSITYRMLVLNTSQIPWNLRRQLEVVYNSIIKELRAFLDNSENLDYQIIEVDDPSRSSKAGQFHANDLMECYLAFGARKEKVDLVKLLLEDQFLKNDFIEGVGNSSFNQWFYKVIDYLIKLDKIFAQYPDKDHTNQIKNDEKGIVQGKQVFRSQPARIGFVTAFSIAIQGELGLEHHIEKQNGNWCTIQEKMDIFLHKLDTKSSDEIGEFLVLDLLSELTTKNSGTTRTRGYKQREFYKEAFSKLIKLNFDVPSMEVCWRTY